jgi:peptide chain release factor 1
VGIGPSFPMAIELPDITPFKKRVDEIDKMMNQSDFFNDARRSATISREQMKLRKLLENFSLLKAAKEAVAEHRELLADSDSDPELKELAEEELPELEETIETLGERILVSMIPPEDSDSRNTIVEIRAGAGGDEASLFAGELFRMYSRLVERRGWTLERMSSSESGISGFKEVAFLIRGEDVYKQMKLESGVHRVQRVPETESQGRIHTSTVTVAVLPEAEEVDVEIDPQELEITTARASGPGGQGVNTTDSAIQILYKPTGMIVTCSDERSQIKNRAKAMTVLRSRLMQAKEEEERAKYAENRKKQVGTGDRSERIRTYNFPQSRLTDHRIGLTIHSLAQVMAGELDEVMAALQAEDQKLKIEAVMNAQVGT